MISYPSQSCSKCAEISVHCNDNNTCIIWHSCLHGTSLYYPSGRLWRRCFNVDYAFVYIWSYLLLLLKERTFLRLEDGLYTVKKVNSCILSKFCFVYSIVKRRVEYCSPMLKLLYCLTTYCGSIAAIKLTWHWRDIDVTLTVITNNTQFDNNSETTKNTFKDESRQLRRRWWQRQTNNNFYQYKYS